jgi:hypothetical protein
MSNLFDNKRRLSYNSPAFFKHFHIEQPENSSCNFGRLNLKNEKIPTTSPPETGRQYHPKLGITIYLLGKKVEE